MKKLGKYDYINRAYNLEVFEGMRIHCCGGECTVVGTSGPYLKVRTLKNRIIIIHPTWEVKYPKQEKKLFEDSISKWRGCIVP